MREVAMAAAAAAAAAANPLKEWLFEVSIQIRGALVGVIDVVYYRFSVSDLGTMKLLGVKAAEPADAAVHRRQGALVHHSRLTSIT